MNILVVSSYLPYPLHSGGHIRLYNLIKRLSARHSITLICEKRVYQTEEDIDEISKIVDEVVVVERKKQWSLNNILKTAFSLHPFLMTGHTNYEMKKDIQQILGRKKFDLIHIETFYVMQNLPPTSIPIVLVEQNVEYLVYERFAKRVNLLLKPLLYLDIAKLKYWEKYFWQKADKLVAVSQEEKALMPKDADIVPNGVDINKFKIKNDSPRGEAGRSKIEEKKVLFIGDFKWVQNRDTVEWILKEIWPEIKLKSGSKKVKLWIVGKNIPTTIKELTNDEDVVFDENAPDDTVEIFKNADVLLSPIRVGGGTSYKILEAMASGVVVVTNKLGVEGIDLEGEEVLIADTAKELAQKTLEVLSDEKLSARLIQNSRKLIEEKYDWEKIVGKLEEVYLSIRK